MTIGRKDGLQNWGRFVLRLKIQFTSLRRTKSASIRGRIDLTRICVFTSLASSSSARSLLYQQRSNGGGIEKLTCIPMAAATECRTESRVMRVLSSFL
jgi:hypothetical protein